jgi:6-phosphogluconolactonase
MALHVYPNLADLSSEAAGWVTEYIAGTLSRQDRFSIVLSGGGTPKTLYELIAQTPYREQIAWDKLHVFWGDERAVPFTDDRNNARMAFTYLLDRVPVPQEQIHIMRTDLDPAAAASEYEKILHSYFAPEPSEPSFDLVLLGMGEDGHTLSLFPGTEVLHEVKSWTKAFWLQAQNMYRITLTRPIVNRASRIVFLAVGENKAQALSHVLEGPADPEHFPSQLIQPEQGQLHWFVDEAAASGLHAGNKSG